MFQKAIFLSILSIIIFSGARYPPKWKPIGPNIHPNPPANFNGISPHGLGRLFDIIIHPKKANQFWVCSPNGGIFFTKNKGKNWKSLSMPVPGGALKMAQHFNAKKNIIAFASNVSAPNRANYSYGIYSTANNGKSWDTILKIVPDEYHTPIIKDLTFVNDTLLYIKSDSIFANIGNKHLFLHKSDAELFRIRVDEKNHTWYFLGKKIIVISNGGKSIISINNNNNEEFKADNCDINFANSTMVLSWKNNTATIHKLQNNCLNTGWNVPADIDAGRTTLAYDKKNNAYLIGGIQLFMYKDSMVTNLTTRSYPSPQYMHDDIREIAFDNDGNTFICHDGGISISNNNYKSWLSISGCGLNISEMYDIDINEQYILAGLQDCGNIYKNRLSNQWITTSYLYGDGGMVRFHKNVAYLMQGTVLLKSVNNFESAEYAYFPIHLSNFNPKTKIVNNKLYIADKQLWKETADYWQNLSKGMEGYYRISGFDVSSDEKTIIVAKEEPVWRTNQLTEKLYLSNDSGKLWTDITNNFPAYSYRFIESIVIDPANDKIFYACLGGFDNKNGEKNRCFKTSDGGKNWENISYNLPNLPNNTIVFHPKMGVLLGTNHGVYQLKNKHWQWLKGLPQAPVTAIKPTENGFLVATYGRGAWQFTL